MTNTPEKWSCLNTFLWFQSLCRSPPSGHVIAAAPAAPRDPAFRHKGSGLVQMSVKRHETLEGRVGKRRRRRRRKPRKEPRGSCTEKMDLGGKKNWSGEEATGGVGRKSIEDRVRKSRGGGRENKKIKMAGGIKSSMERRVKNCLGVGAGKNC